jgi:hypothetical protein
MMKSINGYDNHRSPRGNAKAVETHTKHVEVYRAKVEECRERIAYNSGRVQLHEKRVKHYQKIVIDDRKEVLRHLDRFSEGTEQSGTGKPDDNHQQVVERKELQEAEEKVKDSEKKLEDAKAALEEVMGEKALEQARSDLRSAEHGLGGAEWALQQMETLGQLIRLPMDDLIDVILNRVESDVCAILPDIDRLWLARILCYSRHCTEHGLLFRYEGNKRESAAAPRQNCECQVRDTCPRTIIWIKTLREYTVTPMVEPKPPDMIPVLSFDEATARDEWRELQERVVFLRKRIRQLDFSVISSTVTSKNAARRQTDLKTALQHSRNCLASDPCDRVYAFLGLADKGYSIVPDYRIENSIVHVLIETAQRIILYEKKLDILRFTSQGRTKLGSFLPSWVPDWTSEEDEASRSFTEYCKLHVTDLEQESQLNSPFAASKGLPFEVDFRRDETNESNLDLKVTGIYIDILDELETTFKGPPGLQSFLTSNGKRIITMKSALVDDEVWVLSGATKPVILRSEEDDMYGFLSEALMLEKDGFSSDGMFGGSVDLPSHQAREIWLL